ncbi:MAG: TetR/AcrR family transcriptional regulator [Ruminiclostridium sp.]|nr:TetR/AcrR family transcriptional regulator [Ruminiclostridium sp.]
MAQSTRQDILACARRLFDRHGYNGVSMRDIARELGISVGNLTYHFKKKENLLEAMILDPDRTGSPPPAPQTLEDLTAYSRHMLEVQQTYAFYFDSYHQLAQTSPLLANIQQEMLGKVRQDLTACFQTLEAAGILAPEAWPGQHGTAIRTLTLLLMVRLPGEERRTAGEDGMEQVMEAIQSVLRPLLTAKNG